MTSYRFHTCDVFTDRVFGGNPLAVFPEARGLTDEQMQTIAREMNLSETVFVFPAGDAAHTRKVRIFTPAEELPFAGHPTLGTAHVLTVTGAVDAGEIVLEERVGPIRVAVSRRDERRTFAQLSVAQLPVAGPTPPSREQIAAALSIAPDALADEPIEGMSCGTPFLFVPIRGLDAMASLRVNTAHWPFDYWANAIFAWTRDTVHADSHVHARMFAPAFGLSEDPATGGAAAAFAGVLGKNENARLLRWRIEQGLEMGRPSFLDVEAEKRDGRIVAVRVGGASVSISSGVLEI